MSIRGRKNVYKPARMVNWFAPGMLVQTGLKSIISGLFGNYADRREMEAVLTEETEDELENLKKTYSTSEELWIDFVSDTGDGFNSTFSMASLIAQPELTVSHNDKKEIIPRGKILILGGDQIYPTPTAEIYEQKFKLPFRSALPESKCAKENSPHLYAIPGNHDWYDGLGNFIKIFCQQRNIGGWETKQKRSYFALPLLADYWIWATDIQLNADIDQPQIDYFKKIAGQHMPANAKIILVTAEPAWIYREMYENDKSYNRLIYFIEDVARQENNKFQLKAIITGDLHHYSHYVCTDQDSMSRHLIGAGGGGAFLHLTHNLPKELRFPETIDDKIKAHKEESVYGRLAGVYPSRKASKILNIGNFLFIFRNKLFCTMLGAIYVFIFWMLRTSNYYNTGLNNRRGAVSGTLNITEPFLALLQVPSLCIFAILLIVGFYKFADVRSGRSLPHLVGLLHGLLQCLLIFLIIGFLMSYHSQYFGDFSDIKYYILLVFNIFISGWIVGGFVMGLYLYCTNVFLKMHLDEASSSLVGTGYKNFLRIRIDRNGITIFPIGVKRVTKKWKMKDEDGNIHFSGDLPKYELMENPIIIK